MPKPFRILILGGTTEGRQLAEALAGDPALMPILSLAGRTKNPAVPAIPVRIGGFGGIAGLTAYLGTQAIDLVIDATHPFAEQMSAHAEIACRETAVPLAVFTRPPWTPCEGDRWTEIESADAAARALGADPCRVFLTVGRLQLPAFEVAPMHHYLIRSIDPPLPAPRLPRYQVRLARGPFTLDDEIDLMEREKIAVLVTKNSGGSATYAKIEAARRLCLPVILIRAPARGQVRIFHDLKAILDFIRDRVHQRAPMPRGV